MICLNVILTVKDAANVDEIRELLAEQGRMSRAEPGCMRFEVYHSSDNPNVFILNERWETQAALDIHRNAKACSQLYFPKVVPKVERVAHVSILVE